MSAALEKAAPVGPKPSGSLSQDQVETYHRDGFLHPVEAFSDTEVSAIRSEIEALERDHAAGAGGHDLNQLFRVNGHVVIPLLANLARTPAILDAVASILGDDLMVWSVELFIKEPGSAKIVSWHQDLTYWGMDGTDHELTAWVALSDVSIEAGCMRFIPGSHLNSIVDHEDTFDDDNLLSRGQQIAGIDEANAVYGPLKPGQMSFHHGRTFHASGPNRSTDRRIGLAIRYVTPEVKPPAAAPDFAQMVRGQDFNSGWVNIAPPARLFEPHALALYDRILAAQAVNLAAGATGKVALYKGKAG